MHLSTCTQVVLALYTISHLPRTAIAHQDLPLSHLNLRRATTAESYAPSKVPCPSQPLIRAATGLSSQEPAYIFAKKPKADFALRTWLNSMSANFSTNSTLPSLALVGSGGGLRSASQFAGFTQAFDRRDGTTGVSGLYGAFIYQATLSGGAWYLMAQAAHDWASVSYLQRTTGIDYIDIVRGDVMLLIVNEKLCADQRRMKILDVAEKLAAGYPVTAADVYARLVSYMLFNGTDGGVGNTLSGLASLPSFMNHSVPYPIITSIGVAPGSCQFPAPLSSMTYEYTAYEFGSWDSGIEAFVNTTYLGTNIVETRPVGNECTQGFDNLGFVTGSTSNVLLIVCSVSLPTGSTEITTMENTTLVSSLPLLRGDMFSSPLVVNETQLSLNDGGRADNELALYPMLRPERDIDVSPTPNRYSLTATYNMSLASNLTKMPYIPLLSTFATDNMSMQTKFFGCDEPDAITIIWIPLVSWVSPNCCNLSTFDLEHSYKTTDTLIRNGGLMATQGGDAEWPVCLACAIMKKASPENLPGACEECFQRYCYRNGTATST
ncbi:FabD/lysophospholipase-like protein [Teratosphaeria nubilosa]|uniref:Lysophospholipase n=1 Tax=Teratosphaeria nubilosa TaxID=161662 RepID=A0A6G1L5K1_9PEZI|nr:FabD/lysophospholipase-like protein [Teratosphaeria nubilosa]